MLRFRLSVLLLLFLTLSACAQANDIPDAEATVDAAQTAAVYVAQTALNARTPTIDFSELPTLAPLTDTPTPEPVPVTPSVTPTAAVFPPNFSPILRGLIFDRNMFFVLLGGVQDGKWISAEQAAANMPGASTYDVYASASGPHQVYGYAPQPMIPGGGYTLGTESKLDESSMIAVLQGWQVAHGTAEELPADNELYSQLILDFLAQSGIADPQIGTMHIYRIDLEGDGTDEIFISDTRVESQHGVVAGDHSIILMRKLSGSGVVTVPILVDLYAAIGYGNPFPCTYSVGNFLDLNQDGVMEVIVEFERWEDFGSSVHQVNGENAEHVLGRTCLRP